MSALTPDETILGLLAQQPQHGYELLSCFQDPAQLGHVWRLSTSQLYQVLKRLEKQDLIAGVQSSSEIGPPRVQYAITEAGLARFEAWLNLATPSASIRRIRVEFLSRIYLAGLIEVDAARIIAQQRAVCLRELARLQAELAASQSAMDALSLSLVRAQMEAVLAWIAQIEPSQPLSQPTR